MKNKNDRGYQEVVATHLIFKTAKTSGPTLAKKIKMSWLANSQGTHQDAREASGKLIMKLPYFKRLFASHLDRQPIRYLLPKGGVPILAGPAVIQRFTAMARSYKPSPFGI